MKTKRLLFISCLAAGALIASPSFGKPAKKSAGMSQAKAKRVAPQTTQVMRNDRHNQNISTHTGSTRYYGGTRYSATRSYAGGQYAGTRYYGGTRYGGNYYGGGTRYYNGGGSYPNYGYYSGWPSFELGLRQILGILPVLGTMAAIRTVVTTTTTRTTRQRTAITHQWLQLCSGALANSVTITA